MNTLHTEAIRNEVIRSQPVLPGPGELRPASIDIYVTARCNLSCTTCFLGDAYFNGALMSHSVVDDILSWASGHGVRDVAFLGGEPSTHPDIREFLHAARTRGFTTTRIVTNGGRAFQRFFDEAEKGLLDVVYVSIDGHTSATHDRVRGNGSFRLAMESIEQIHAAGQTFIITLTVNRHVVNDVTTMINLAQDLGAARLNIHWLSSMGRASDSDLAIDPDEWIGLCNAVRAHNLRRSDFVVDLQQAFALRTDEDAVAVPECALRSGSNLQFLPDGSVHVCGLTVDRPELSAFQWHAGQLTPRSGWTEREIGQHFTSIGCPVRGSIVREPAPGPTWVPICIYRRSHSS